jgi:DNA-binding beta-propeller fold protein YncE
MFAKIFPSVMLLATMLVGYNPIAGAETELKTGGFHEVARFRLGGDGGWDYLTVDADARRLYIARSNRLMVIDADSGKLLGEVSGLDGAHGVVIVKDQDVGFATSGKSGEVFVFDLKNFKVLKRIKAGVNPDALLYDPASKRVLAFNGKSKEMTAIDAGTMNTLGTLALPGKPEFAVSDGAGRVFVNLEDQSALLAIDPVQLKILGRYPLKPCEEPTGLSMDRESRRLIVGCGNRIAAIVDANAGHVSQTFEVGDGVDATAFDPERKLAFVSAGEGRLTILAEDQSWFHLLQDLATVKGARTLAVDTKTGRVFLPIAQFKPVNPSEKTQGHFRPSVIPDTFAVLVEGER